MTVFKHERITEPMEAAHLLAWEHAAAFEEQQRWLSHKPDSLSLDEHRELFGADADNLRHGLLQRKISEHMARRLDLDAETTEFLAVLGQYHDIGECIAAGSEGGDKNWMLKSDADEAEEQAVLYGLIYHDPHFERLSPDFKDRFFATMADAKQQEPTTFEGAFFDASERVGYLRTQLVVAQGQPERWPVDLMAPARSPTLNKLTQTERANLQHMHMEVIGTHVSDLHRRHMMDGTTNHNLDDLIASMLIESAPRLYGVVEHLNDRAFIESFCEFEFQRFFVRFSDDADCSDPVMAAENAADTALTNFDQAHDILKEFSEK